MISEIREYLPMPGRLPDVLAFFHEDVLPLFARHGMEVTQMGVTTLGDNCFSEFVYTMRFADLAEMEQKWGAFVGDPGFGSALAAREVSGPLYRSIRRRVVDGGQFDHLIGAPASA